VHGVLSSGPVSACRDPRQIILNTLKFIKCRLMCATQKGVAIVESGADCGALSLTAVIGQSIHLLGRLPNFGSRPNTMGGKFPSVRLSVRPSVHKKFL